MTTGIYRLRAKDVMSNDVVFVHPEDSINEVLQLMVENRVAALPVMDRSQRCIGMISSSDLVEITKDLDNEMKSLDATESISIGWLAKRLVNQTTQEQVCEVMSENVASVRPDTPLAEVAAKMVRERVHHLPVLDIQERLVGILSTMDIMAALADSAHKPG